MTLNQACVLLNGMARPGPVGVFSIPSFGPGSVTDSTVSFKLMSAMIHPAAISGHALDTVLPSGRNMYTQSLTETEEERHYAKKCSETGRADNQ